MWDTLCSCVSPTGPPVAFHSAFNTKKSKLPFRPGDFDTTPRHCHNSYLTQGVRAVAVGLGSGRLDNKLWFTRPSWPPLPLLRQILNRLFHHLAGSPKYPYPRRIRHIPCPIPLHYVLKSVVRHHPQHLSTPAIHSIANLATTIILFRHPRPRHQMNELSQSSRPRVLICSRPQQRRTIVSPMAMSPTIAVH